MGILERFNDIMMSNINALLDKCENPEKMIDQSLRNMREDLAKVKSETAGVKADEKSAKRKLDDCQAEIDKVTKAAENALIAGNEDDARQLLAKKSDLTATLTSYQQTYDVTHENAVKMEQMYKKLTREIESLETRQDAIKAKVATAKAQERVNKVAGGIDTSGSLGAFERMEAKANKMLDKAEAEAELTASTHSSDDLVNKYATGGQEVDAELAAMKAKLGL